MAQCLSEADLEREKGLWWELCVMCVALCRP
jgi:hypothetical protein